MKIAICLYSRKSGATATDSGTSISHSTKGRKPPTRPTNIPWTHILENLPDPSSIFPWTKCGGMQNDIAYIFYTSGTHRQSPRACLLSHKSVLADVSGVTEFLHLEEGMTILVFLPLFHVNAMLTTHLQSWQRFPDGSTPGFFRRGILGSGG